MKRILYSALLFGLALSLGGCSLFGSWGPKRAAWRSQAENACLSSGAVKPGPAVRPMGEVDGPGACGADRPFKVSAVGRNQKVPLNESTALNCPMVAAVDDWFDRVVQPAAENRFGQPVVGVEHMGSYNCRSIAGHRQMSEHAYMNALDISGFKLADGRTVRVKTGWRSPDIQEVAFLHEVGGASCDDFTTVLGPGSGAAHQDHLHLDLARHSKGRHVCKGADEPVPDGGRLVSFFKDTSITTTGSVPNGNAGTGMGTGTGTGTGAGAGSLDTLGYDDEPDDPNLLDK